jgi:rhodanese-related sulfurtransferase
MKKIFGLLLVVLVLLTACSSTEVESYTYPEILEFIESGEGLAVDVRTLTEYQEGHIEGAYNLDLADIQAGDFGELNDKSAMLLVYCRTGGRSSIAYKLFIEEGYTNVYDIGGIVDWPYEVVQ